MVEVQEKEVDDMTENSGARWVSKIGWCVGRNPPSVIVAFG